MPADLVTGSSAPSPVQSRPARGRFWSGVLVGAVAMFVLCVALARYANSPAAGGPRSANHATTAGLAKLIARPLVPQGQAEPNVSDAKMLAALALRLNEADALAGKNTELAPIAREYGDAMRSLQVVCSEAPSVQPLVRAGLETWRGSLDNDNRGFMLGLLGVGAEVSRFAELMEKMNAIHLRIVACRLRVAEFAERSAPPEVKGGTVTAQFTQSGGLSPVTSDTLFLKNVSGTSLTQVVVVLELTGASGETFSNCFYTESWKPDQTLLAVCRSERPGRETVGGVKRVQFRVISAERSSRWGDLNI